MAGKWNRSNPIRFFSFWHSNIVPLGNLACQLHLLPVSAFCAWLSSSSYFFYCGFGMKAACPGRAHMSIRIMQQRRFAGFGFTQVHDRNNPYFAVRWHCGGDLSLRLFISRRCSRSINGTWRRLFAKRLVKQRRSGIKSTFHVCSCWRNEFSTAH